APRIHAASNPWHRRRQLPATVPSTGPQRRDSPLSPQLGATHAHADGTARRTLGDCRPRRGTPCRLARDPPRRPLGTDRRRSGAWRLSLLGPPRFVRLVLGVRGPRRPCVRTAGRGLLTRTPRPLGWGWRGGPRWGWPPLFSVPRRPPRALR